MQQCPEQRQGRAVHGQFAEGPRFQVRSPAVLILRNAFDGSTGVGDLILKVLQ